MLQTLGDLNGGLTPETAASLVADGSADAIAFGGLSIADPDLPVRNVYAGRLRGFIPTEFESAPRRGPARRRPSCLPR